MNRTKIAEHALSAQSLMDLDAVMEVLRHPIPSEFRNDEQVIRALRNIEKAFVTMHIRLENLEAMQQAIQMLGGCDIDIALKGLRLLKSEQNEK